jgi:hypothetical protein
MFAPEAKIPPGERCPQLWCQQRDVLALKGLRFLPVVAVAFGWLTGAVVNFATAKLWVFRHR